MKNGFVLFLAFLLGAPLYAQGVRWAGNVAGGSANALHAPDDRHAVAGPPLVLSDFSPTFRYVRLAALLRVSDAALARADVIAFEGNGGHGAGVEAGWESSIWTFTDGTNTYTANFNEKVGRSSDPSVVATGPITGDAFRAFFGICSPNPANAVVGYILFDLDAVKPRVDPASPRLRITIQNGFRPDRTFGEGTPDPDAVGVLTSCPKP
ncbi:MAG TPA: hypothetical protein VKB93_16360 [Thermoanaerobaculia bacterium]|nr:hypothetical protein [Thermoanaerobaculia bacterium]